MSLQYKRTFDAVHMSPERQQQIRSLLIYRCSLNQKEEKMKTTHKSRIVLVVAAVILTLALVGFAYGSQIIQLLGGGRVEFGTDRNGDDYIAIDIGFATDPVEVRDGRIYFVLDDSGIDITDRCSQDTYYEYKHMGANGYEYVVIIGGTPDTVGWAEYVWDDNGDFIGSNATYPNEKQPAWLTAANEALTA